MPAIVSNGVVNFVQLQARWPNSSVLHLICARVSTLLSGSMVEKENSGNISCFHKF